MTPTKRYAHYQTPLERAVRAIPRKPAKIGACWMDGKVQRFISDSSRTKAGARQHKLIRLHVRQA